MPCRRVHIIRLPLRSIQKMRRKFENAIYKISIPRVLRAIRRVPVHVFLLRKILRNSSLVVILYRILYLGSSDGPAVDVDTTQCLCWRSPLRETHDMTPTTFVAHNVVQRWCTCTSYWRSSSGRLLIVLCARKNLKSYPVLIWKGSSCTLSQKSGTNTPRVTHDEHIQYTNKTFSIRCHAIDWGHLIRISWKNACTQIKKYLLYS